MYVECEVNAPLTEEHLYANAHHVERENHWISPINTIVSEVQLSLYLCILLTKQYLYANAHKKFNFKPPSYFIHRNPFIYLLSCSGLFLKKVF